MKSLCVCLCVFVWGGGGSNYVGSNVIIVLNTCNERTLLEENILALLHWQCIKYCLLWQEFYVPAFYSFISLSDAVLV
jgi:hypothetical protein